MAGPRSTKPLHIWVESCPGENLPALTELMHFAVGFSAGKERGRGARGKGRCSAQRFARYTFPATERSRNRGRQARR